MGYQTAGVYRLFKGQTRLADSVTLGVAQSGLNLALLELPTAEYARRDFTTWTGGLDASELSATGYSAGGVALDNDVNDRLFVEAAASIGFRYVDVADLTFTNLIDAGGAIITGVAIYDTAAPTTVICTAPFVNNQTVTLSATAQTLVLTFPAAGLFGFAF